MCADIEAKTITFWEDDYGFAGTRAQVGTFGIVAIDINHPNYGYFAEFIAFWRSPHMRDWQSIPVHRGSHNINTPGDLIKQFPRFSSLFADEEE